MDRDQIIANVKPLNYQKPGDNSHPTDYKPISAGGILTKKEAGVVYLYLPLYFKTQKFGLLKGHLEEGETVELAAIREVLEESGLEVKIIKKLGTLSRWAHEHQGNKEIHLFLVKAISSQFHSPQENCQWVPFDQAISNMQHEEEANFLLAHKPEIFESL